MIAGSILVFVPSFGAYVTPAILGGNKEGLLGSFIVSQFLSAQRPGWAPASRWWC